MPMSEMSEMSGFSWVGVSNLLEQEILTPSRPIQNPTLNPKTRHCRPRKNPTSRATRRDSYESGCRRAPGGAAAPRRGAQLGRLQLPLQGAPGSDDSRAEVAAAGL